MAKDDHPRANLPTAPSGGQGLGSRLDSWKEIASYLRRSERTVRRWEETEELPVHRQLHEKRGSVYAYAGELDAWWQSRRQPERSDLPEQQSPNLNGSGRPQEQDEKPFGHNVIAPPVVDAAPRMAFSKFWLWGLLALLGGLSAHVCNPANAKALNPNAYGRTTHYHSGQ
jgi:hypothetical protein